MLIKSTQKFIHTSPRKLRLIVDSIKRLTPQIALDKLEFTSKAASLPIAKALKTAIADAKNNFKQSPEKLTIETIMVNPGTTLKRGQPVSRGQYHAIKKRTSHVTVILNSANESNTVKN